LRKALKVKFIHEAGVDQGGVQKEFFQLLVAELFDPKFGMFEYSEEMHCYWFNKNSLESHLQFELIGIVSFDSCLLQLSDHLFELKLIGIAIYNSVILDIRFPMVTFKKLLNRSIALEDLKALYPSLYNGFKRLLEFDGDVESVYMRNFTVEYEYFGESKVYELKPGGAQISLTNQNREEYVQLYAKYVLEDSISVQFAAFKSGFELVCASPLMRMFEPEELELLVCGSQEFDFDSFEEGARYEDPYSRQTPIIQHLWKILHSFTETEKRSFLQFCTGSDRVPISGLSNLRLTISRSGGDSEILPTSHTCFNHLLLPEYSSEAKLKRKLLIAIQNARGFGLM
jgi:ubiquitin-protein ligase E3 A